jgi:hypothetical protein
LFPAFDETKVKHFTPTPQDLTTEAGLKSDEVSKKWNEMRIWDSKRGDFFDEWSGYTEGGIFKLKTEHK